MAMHVRFARVVIWLVLASAGISRAQVTVLQNATILDGSDNPPRAHANLVIEGDRIRAIQPAGTALPSHAMVIDVSGKTIMPSLINCHGHIGLLKGTKTASANYTRENAERHLRQYQKYGVQAVQVMGTDHDEVYQWRDASVAGKMSGARLFTAGHGFGVPNGMPPLAMGMDQVYRPASADEARRQVKELAARHPDLVKVWVDDFYGQLPRMKPEIYSAIIEEAHRNNLRVAAHVFYLEDAGRLVDAGVDILAHSVRDAVIPDALLARMKRNNVAYIPTLALDDFATAYAGDPAWINDPFFRSALEPGVYEMITSAAYRQTLADDTKPAGHTAGIERAALPIALKNVKRVYDAGILVALGTDSGASAIRPFGFAEHRELQLLVQAGLTPRQAITIATRNGAQLLHASKNLGTLAVGLKANFIVLDKDPVSDIRNTETISAVWQGGKRVSGALR